MAVILLVPFVAMQFTDEVKWVVADFVIIGTLLLGIGLLYELITVWVRSIRYRVVVGAFLAVMALLVWVELAVGVFGTSFAGSWMVIAQG
jgi:hypothetical protein